MGPKNIKRILIFCCAAHHNTMSSRDHHGRGTAKILWTAWVVRASSDAQTAPRHWCLLDNISVTSLSRLLIWVTFDIMNELKSPTYIATLCEKRSNSLSYFERLVGCQYIRLLGTGPESDTKQLKDKQAIWHKVYTESAINSWKNIESSKF